MTQSRIMTVLLGKKEERKKPNLILVGLKLEEDAL